MFKWEYQTVELYSHLDLDGLNMHGDGGWELVQIIPAATLMQQVPMAYAIFKRAVTVELVELEGAAEGFTFAHER